MEPRRDGPGRPFDEYYTQTPTHLWIYDLDTAELEEICTKDRLAPFVTPALLVGDDRMLVQVVRDERRARSSACGSTAAMRASSPGPAKACPMD